MICSKCNNQLPDGAKFCDYCGTRFDLVNTQQNSMYSNGSATFGNQNATENNNVVEKPEKKPSKGVKPLIFIIVTVVFCLALAASVFVIFGQLGKIDDLEKLAEERKETISSLEKDLSDANETIADLEDEISSLEDEIEDLESEILGLEDEIWNMEDVIVDLEDEISSLENSGGDENSAKQVEVIAELLNVEIQENPDMQTLSALGLTVECEARGTELVMAFVVSNTYLEDMDFSDIIDDMGISLEQVRETYPVISNVVFEVRRADDTVIYTKSLVESVPENEAEVVLLTEAQQAVFDEFSEGFVSGIDSSTGGVAKGSVKLEGSTVKLICTYQMTFDDATAAQTSAALEEQSSVLKDGLEFMVDAFKAEIPSITSVVLIYDDLSGTVLLELAL